MGRSARRRRTRTRIRRTRRRANTIRRSIATGSRMVMMKPIKEIRCLCKTQVKMLPATGDLDPPNEIERRIADKEAEGKSLPVDEEAVAEDVLIITTDKSLVDELETSEAHEDKEREKNVVKEEKRRERMLPFPPSRWEEDSEEDGDSCDSKKNLLPDK